MRTFATLAAVFVLAAPPSLADEARTIQSTEVERLARFDYLRILRDAAGKGHHYNQAQIEAGLRRHYEEMSARLRDNGYVILAVEGSI